jgi:hypothetical protein
LNLLPAVVKFRPYWRRWNYRWPFRNRQVIPAPVPALRPRDLRLVPPVRAAEGVPAVLPAAGPDALAGANGDVAEKAGQNGHKPQAWIPEQFR